jgi:hypothetical protein
MTNVDIDRMVRAYLDDGPNAISDRGLQAALDEIQLTRQRRAIVAGGIQMRLNWRLAGVAVAAVLLLSVGSAWVGRSTAPVASPTIPTPSAPSAGLGIPRLLEAGTYTTSAFGTPLTYAVPAGWTLTADEPTRFALSIAALSWEFDVTYDPVASTPNASFDPSVGRSARELMDFVADHPGVEVITPPTAFELGDLAGYWAEIDGGSTELNLFGQAAADGTGCDPGDGRFACGGRGLYPDARARFAILDAPGGRTVLIWLSQFDGTTLIEPATRIVESFAFDVP